MIDSLEPIKKYGNDRVCNVIDYDSKVNKVFIDLLENVVERLKEENDLNALFFPFGCRTCVTRNEYEDVLLFWIAQSDCVENIHLDFYFDDSKINRSEVERIIMEEASELGLTCNYPYEETDIIEVEV